MDRIEALVKNKSLQKVLMSAAAVLLVVPLAVTGCSGDSGVGSGSAAVLSGAGAANTVTVNGSATVTSPPDEAIVVLTIENDGATPAAAMDATSAQSNQLLEKLKSVEIEESAIQTSSVTLYPIRNYDPNTGKESLSGYRAQNSVKVTMTDAATVAKVLAAGVDAGVTLISGPDWRLRDDSQAVTEALKQAVVNARTKAESLVGAEGASLGEVITMTEGSVQLPVPIYTGSRAAADVELAGSMEPEVTAGTLDVTATVTITYELKR